MVEPKLDLKNNHFDNYFCFKLLKRTLIMSLSKLEYPDTYKGFLSSNSSNITCTYMRFCGKQRGFDCHKISCMYLELELKKPF